jgi:hypothetical protein
VVRHHHFCPLEPPSGVPFLWFPDLVNAHEHISGLGGPLVVPDAPTLPLAKAPSDEGVEVDATGDDTAPRIGVTADLTAFG